MNSRRMLIKVEAAEVRSSLSDLFLHLLIFESSSCEPVVVLYVFCP